MARDYARLKIAVWDDADYKDLGLELQGLFCALMAYPGISWAGVIDYIPKRLIKIDRGLTESALFEKIAQLHNHHRFVQLDMETDELLVRTFIKHDGIMKMPNVAKAMAKAVDKIQSEALAQIVMAELGRLYLEEPNLPGWSGLESGFGEFLERVYMAAEEITSNPSRNPSAMGSVRRLAR